MSCLWIGISSSSIAQDHVLVFSKTEGFRHEAIADATKAIAQMGEQRGFSVVATEDSTVFNSQSLEQYQSVIFLLTTGDILSDAQQQAMQSFVEDGGGFVGVHSASDTEYNWSWYGKLVGGYFSGHPNHPNVRRANLYVTDANHPATNAIPMEWSRVDEWYDFRMVSTTVTPLILVDEMSYKNAHENPSSVKRPISWYQSMGNGRSFYTGLGHTSESYIEPLFLAHLWGGICYALARDEC